MERLETVCGCFFDRNEDGTIHQKAFAGQSFDRTVHKGDLTGIEITNRVAEQLARRGVDVLEETRAVALLPARREPGRVAGALLLDIRSGGFIAVNAKCALLATGGGPTLYKSLPARRSSPPTAWRLRGRRAPRSATWRWCSSTLRAS